MRVPIVLLWSILFIGGCVAPSPPTQPAAEAQAEASQPSSQTASTPPPVAQSSAEQPISGQATPAPPRPTGQGQSTPAAQPQQPRIGQPIKMPPMSDPLPPERVQAPPSSAPVQVIRTCKVDSDCVVKDVGNCCGYFPACVHRNSPTDPAGVRAQCEKNGMASVCGFQEIPACRCVRNQCVGVTEPVAGWIDDPAPAPTPTPPAER